MLDLPNTSPFRLLELLILLKMPHGQERLLQGKILKVNVSLSLLLFFAKVGKDSNASFIFVKHIFYVKYDYLFAQIVYLEVTREVHFYFMLTLTVW